MDAGAIAAFAAVMLALSSAVAVLFTSMKKWIERQDGVNQRLVDRDDAQQTELTSMKTRADAASVRATSLEKQIADCEERHAETDEKFRRLASVCPVTQQECPLRGMFQK